MDVSRQATNRVFMVRPSAFYSNPETAGDNVFQNVAASLDLTSTQSEALLEFENLVKKLREAGVEVLIVDDNTKTPDAIFPNNWVAFLELQGKSVISLFPMLSPLRRRERRKDIVDRWRASLGSEVWDYCSFEDKGQYLEGTGSMVLDREKAIAYACLSQRTDRALLEKFCQDCGFRLVSFRAFSKQSDGSPVPIYHTNVMLQVGTSFAVACLDSIADQTEKDEVRSTLEKSGKEVIAITMEQMSQYACNCLQLQGSSNGEYYLVMSTRAYRSLTGEQLARLSSHSCTLLHSDLEVIEDCGGGSARCMIAEVFPPRS